MSDNVGDGQGVNGSPSGVFDLDVVALHDGTLLVTHPAGRCLFHHCVIHNPSPHSLRAAPLVWDDALRLMFRMCDHGSVHPDPDSLGFKNFAALAKRGGGAPHMLAYDGWHPCCEGRCCVEADGADDVEDQPEDNGGKESESGT